MTQGERTVNGVTLHEVLAYRWGLYMISAADRHTYESGVGEWMVAYMDPTTVTMSYVDRWWTLADAVQGARFHRQQLDDARGSDHV